MADGILVKDLHAWFGPVHVLKGIDLAMAPNAVTAIIGPSGCGKSTFVRCLNRMHEVVPGARARERSSSTARICTARRRTRWPIRRRIGMVFQKPNPFPTMSVSTTWPPACGWTASGDAPTSRRPWSGPCTTRRSGTR